MEQLKEDIEAFENVELNEETLAAIDAIHLQARAFFIAADQAHGLPTDADRSCRQKLQGCCRWLGLLCCCHSCCANRPPPWLPCPQIRNPNVMD